jgi:Phage portal protein, SPP1 Gp6-like
MRYPSVRLTTPAADNGSARPLDPRRLREALDRLVHSQRPRYRRLWAYYRNPMRVCGAGSAAVGAAESAERPYRQAQEWGLPARITGFRAGGEPFADASLGSQARKEVVIENDIAWRVDTMVDYLFGKPLVVTSAAPDPARREAIGRLLRMILANNGGIEFLQQLALAGSVYGFVDVLVKAVNCEQGMAEPAACGTQSLGESPAPEAEQTPGDGEGTSGARAARGPAPATEGESPSDQNDEPTGRVAGAIDATDALLQRVARMIRLEIVEPARALPLLSPRDWKSLEAYGHVFDKTPQGADGTPKSDPSTWWGRLRSLLNNCAPSNGAGCEKAYVIELMTPHAWWRIEDGKLLAHGANSLGEIPLVHIQNAAAAFEYSGMSDVEPLIPLQDELNTRLSDRAHRITLQSFKMYLGKGIDGFVEQPVSPGRIWMTDNEQAQIQEFGGDSSCPSEEAHVADVREALDKSSGVTPIAAGALKNRIGRLTSAAALRITLLALLSKTDKKRTLYGAGIERMCELALRWLDCAGVFKTTPEERRIELHWPSPLPENEIEKLQEAEIKLKLGVQREVVLRELGY